jgi:hypothetical protein
MNESHSPKSRSEASKKAYTTPQLIEYGPVEKLTATGSGGVGEAGLMGMQMCL